ncbi:MAG: 23S rRNA pseudouridine1911/1915/1917 synthase [Myxococcota bacterium]
MSQDNPTRDSASNGAGSLDIIYLDNHLLVVNKPAGVLSQGDATGDASMLDLGKAHLKAVFNKPGNVFLGLVHRLDRVVCGVMVFARTSKAASRLSEQFRNRTVSKLYEAIVQGIPESEAELMSTLDGKACSLSYRVVETRGNRARLQVRLGTGRKHQIRRMLSEIGHPVVGDSRYGGVRLDRRVIALRASELRLEHPTTKEELVFTGSVPEWWPW